MRNTSLGGKECFLKLVTIHEVTKRCSNVYLYFFIWNLKYGAIIAKGINKSFVEDYTYKIRYDVYLTHALEK